MKQILLFLFLTNTIAFNSEMSTDRLGSSKNLPIEQVRAYQILQSKCNVCHQTQNPSKVFTRENMNGFSGKINRQVFFWKRMPKGDDYTLTSKEKTILKNWINKL